MPRDNPTPREELDMTDLQSAIAAKLDQQRERHSEASRRAFAPDPALETLGTRLDLLRDADPTAYNHPHLAGDRQRVATYRQAKAAHETTQETN